MQLLRRVTHIDSQDSFTSVAHWGSLVRSQQEREALRTSDGAHTAATLVQAARDNWPAYNELPRGDRRAPETGRVGHCSLGTVKTSLWLCTHNPRTAIQPRTESATTTQEVNTTAWKPGSPDTSPGQEFFPFCQIKLSENVLQRRLHLSHIFPEVLGLQATPTVSR